MLTTTPARTALWGAAALLLTACGGGHGHDPERLGEMIIETVRTSARGGAPGLGVPDTAFDPTRYVCVPAVDTRVDDPWRTEKPRSRADGSVELGLLAPDSAEATSVTASVTGPGGDTATAATTAVPGEWTRVRYPDDFGGAEDSGGPEDAPASGVYTVVWTDSDSEAPLTCGGFEAG